jgi:hypothetical protein
MLESDEFGRNFVKWARDRAMIDTLYMVTGKFTGEFQEVYERLYKKYDNIELFRKIAAVAVDLTCEKLLASVASGQFAHTPIEGDPDLTKEMFKDGGWIDRFSIFGK